MVINNYKMRRVYIILLYFFTSFCAFAQDSSILQKYICEGIRNNLIIKRNDLSIKIATESLNQVKSLFLPELSFNSSYSLAYGGRTFDIPTGDLLNPIYNTLNGLIGNNMFPNIGNVSEMFLPNNYHDNKLGLSLQLLNIDTYYSYKASKDIVSINQAKKEIYKNELKRAITVAYLDYLTALEINSILDFNRKILVELEKVNIQFIKAGIKNKNTIYDVRFETSQLDSKIADNKKNVELLKAQFNLLLNRDLSDSIEVDSLLTNVDVDTFYKKIIYDNEINKRQELNMFSKMISLQENLLKKCTYSVWIPKIYFLNNIGFQGFKYKFDSKQFYNFAQINLRWDLFLGGRQLSKRRSARYQVENAKLEFEEVKKNIELEKKKCLEEIITALQKYKSKSAACDSAREAFFLANKQYREGQILWLEVIRKQGNYLSAQIQLSVQKYSILIKYAELEKAIGNL